MTQEQTALDAPPRPAARALGVVGEVLVTVGVLVGLYLVWHLFYTDVQSARTQQQALDEIAWFVPPVTASDATAPATISDEWKRYTPDGAPLLDEPPKGTTFAVLHVPRWGGDYAKPVTQGVTRRDVLDRLGIGHYPGTAMPGEIGNFAVAGHRTTYGKPFSDIDQLVEGDALVVETEDAWYVYRVTGYVIVPPENIDPISPNPITPIHPPSTAYITLTTCHPKFSAALRYDVHGVLEYWAPTGHGVPSEIVGEA